MPLFIVELWMFLIDIFGSIAAILLAPIYPAVAILLAIAVIDDSASRFRSINRMSSIKTVKLNKDAAEQWEKAIKALEKEDEDEDDGERR